MTLGGDRLGRLLPLGWRIAISICAAAPLRSSRSSRRSGAPACAVRRAEALRDVCRSGKAAVCV